MSEKTFSKNMTNSKIISLLRTFSQVEIKAFESFLASRYFNKSKTLKLFYAIIQKQYPEFDPKQLEKSRVFEQLFPGQPFEDKKIRYLMSDLLKLGYKFLLIQDVEAQKEGNNLRLLEAFVDRRLEKHYDRLIKKIVPKFEVDQEAGVNHFYSQMRLADVEQEHFSRLQLRRFDNNIQLGSDQLNKFYVLKKLKYACGMLDRQALLKGTYDPDLPDNWMEWLQSKEFWGEKVIEMFAMVYMSLKEEETAFHFNRLTDLLHSGTTGIGHKDAKELFLYAINFCARKMRKGEDRYVETALGLYLKGIQEQILLDNGFLSPWTFGNIVKLALRLERFDWIEDFIDEHRSHLHPDFQKNAIQYNLAELHCYKKEFEKALTYLNKVEFSDMSYHLGSRIMLSKIYYELNERDALLSLMSSFVMFLKRNRKISDSIRKTCLHFCDYLFLIVREKTIGIEEKIKNTDLLTDRDWLLEKAAAL